jgi:hypothetical protein
MAYFVIIDCPFVNSELQNILTENLSIKCSFPCFHSGKFGSTMRCMLEKEDDLKYPDSVEFIEDIICKVIPVCISAQMCFSNESERSLQNVYSLEVHSHNHMNVNGFSTCSHVC